MQPPPLHRIGNITINMKQWWRDTDKRNRSIRRKTFESVTLCVTKTSFGRNRTRFSTSNKLQKVSNDIISVKLLKQLMTFKAESEVPCTIHTIVTLYSLFTQSFTGVTPTAISAATVNPKSPKSKYCFQAVLTLLCKNPS